MMSLLFRCLASLTDAALADAMLGDLEEMRARRRSSRAAATLWFWRTAIGIVFHVAQQKLRGALRAMHRSNGGSRGVGGDLRQAVRSLGRRPAFSAAVVLLLALGVGANAAVFSMVYAVVLKPIPYRDLDRLVFVWRETGTRAGNRHSIQTGARIHDIARHNTTLESFAVTKPWDTAIEGIVDIIRADGADRLRGASVTPNFFELLGVRAQLGRVFSSADGEAAPAAVISHGLWTRMFGGHAAVIGAEVRLARGNLPRTEPSYTIVGVLPPEVRFTYPRDTEIYLLLPWTRIAPERSLEYTLIARLRAGVTPQQAEAEMTAIAVNTLRSTVDLPPDAMAQLIERSRALVEPMQEHVSAEVRAGAWLLAGVAALVLVIACVNIALLSMASSVDRTSELAVRAALGAGPARILRLLVVEQTVLAVLGAAAGLGVAAAALPAVRAFLPGIVPRADEVVVNGGIVLFACGLTAVAALLSSVVPATFVLGRDLLAAVKQSAPTATDRDPRRWRSAVVGVQVAVVLVLLVGGTLLLHSFWSVQQVDLGFEGEGLLTFETRFYNPAYRRMALVAEFETQLLERVRQLAGVEAAAITTAVPMRGVDFRHELAPPGGPPRTAHMRAVTPGFFDLLRIPVRAGRVFTESDRADSPRVMVVSESLARLLFGPQNPIGRRLPYGQGPAADEGYEIIGVVGDVRYAEVVQEATPAFYVARAQNPTRLICLVVKPQPGMRDRVTDALRGIVRTLDPEQPIEGLAALSEIVSESTADRRFYAFATAAFGSIALLLAVAGLFGAVSRTVMERRREIAIRAAVGADSREIVRLVLGYGLIPVAAGAAAGTLAALAGSRLLRGFLFEVAPTDASTYAAAVVLVVAVGAAACVLPARRALRFEPASLLRD
jgi:putative ABC transport system permease protein